MALRVVNFGSGKGGLATVGFTVYGVNGAVVANRSTTGVVELGTSTGVYCANITVPDYDAVVLWDTGEATPRYATEDYQHQIQDIVNNTGRIENIYNSIKNIYEFQSALMDRLGLIQKNEGLVKINEKIDKLGKKDIPDITAIEEVFNRAFGKIVIPEAKSPDISPMISAMKSELDKFPKSKDYSGYFSSLNKHLASISTYFANLKASFDKFEGISARVEELSQKLNSLDVNDKEFIKSKDNLAQEVQKLNQFIHILSSSSVLKDFQDINNMNFAFGHLRSK